MCHFQLGQVPQVDFTKQYKGLPPVLRLTLSLLFALLASLLLNQPTYASTRASGLQASGFLAGNSLVTSDDLVFLNAAMQQFDTKMLLDSGGNVWRSEDASVATKQLQPGESFLIRRRNRAANMSWANTVSYSVPLQGT